MVCAVFLAVLLLLGGMLSAAGAAITVVDGYVVEYDTIDLNMMTTAGEALTSDQNIGATTGPFMMQVAAKATPDDYKATVKSADGTITQGVNFKVVESTLPLTLSEASVVLFFGCPARPTHDVTISGGQPPYAAVSEDPTHVTASVSGTTLTLTAVEFGLVNVVVTDAVGGKATVSVNVGAADGCFYVGGDVGIKTYWAYPYNYWLFLELNVTDNGVNPPAGLKQEWLVFGAIVNGVQTPYFFLTDSGQIVQLTSTTDPAAVTFTFDHTWPVQMLSNVDPPGYPMLGLLGLKRGDTFFYLYAWSPTVVTNFSNAPDLKSDNVVIVVAH